MSKSKSKSKTKDFLKKSSTKLKKTLEIFQNKSHENKYSQLGSLDESADQEPEIIVLENESEGDSPEVILVESDSDSLIRNDDKDLGGSKIPSNNELTDNTDFISLKFSDSDDDSDSEVDNEEDAYSIDDGETDIRGSGSKRSNSEAPWIQEHDHSTQREIADWLTMEIKDFIAYISPSKMEIEMRNSTVRRLREAITSLWPDCEVHVFGSYATDLYLPGSDIDMVIVSSHGSYETRNSLYRLSSFLKQKNLAKNVEVIAKAKVPIIKFTESESNIHIDVSFERTNGIEAARVIREWLTETPGLRELVLIVKQFLSARKLNNVHVGGLGGYSIICLVYSFLKLHPRLSTGNLSPYENLGVLLIEFFELYGRNFGYDNVIVCVERDNVCYLNKSHYPDLKGRSPFALAIQDPSDPSNNISRGSFNIRDIKKAFNGAYELLINICYELESATYRERLGKSILGNVIKYRGKERDFKDERDKVVNEALHDDTASIIDVQPYIPYSDDTDSSSEEVVSKKSKKIASTGGKENRKRKVDDFMGLEADSDIEAEKEAPKLKRTNSNLDKEARREYWLKKGNVIA